MRAKQVARKLSVSSEELKSVITNFIVFLEGTVTNLAI